MGLVEWVVSHGGGGSQGIKPHKAELLTQVWAWSHTCHVKCTSLGGQEGSQRPLVTKGFKRAGREEAPEAEVRI